MISCSSSHPMQQELAGANSLLNPGSAEGANREKSLSGRAVTAEVPSHAREGVFKATGYLLASVFNPFTKVISKTVTTVLSPSTEHPLVAAKKKMKESEEQRKFEALKTIYFRAYPQLESIRSQIESDLGKDDVKQAKLIRYLIRSEQSGDPNLRSLEAESHSLIKTLACEDFNDKYTLHNSLVRLGIAHSLSDEELGKISMELFATREKEIRRSAEQLEAIVHKFCYIFHQTNQSYPEMNRNILQNLREALHSPAYKALKEDTENPVILFLHRLAIAFWNDVKVLEAYKEFGQACLPDEPQEMKDGKELRRTLEASYAKVSPVFHTDHGFFNKLSYASTHPAQALGSMASEGGTMQAVASLMGKGTYDSHLKLQNNPSLQGTTHIVMENFGVKVNNCYGGTPNAGNNIISPEFEAACQAAENSQFARDPDPEIPNMVLYTNFQDIESTKGEGERSYSIMRLNKLFPLSFRGITLAKDSDFYMMRDFKKQPEKIIWKSSQDFADEMLYKLLNDACYTYEGRQGNHEGHGIYLPGNKFEWEPILKAILSKAQAHFERYETAQGEAAYKLCGAFQEYVYSMIQGYLEIKAAKELHEKGQTQHPFIMVIQACKENIDRGGAANTKYLNLRLDPNFKERAALITGVFQSRALSARDRVILENRLPQIMSFMEHVEPQNFKEDLMDLLKSFGFEIQKYKFVPAL